MRPSKSILATLVLVFSTMPALALLPGWTKGGAGQPPSPPPKSEAASGDFAELSQRLSVPAQGSGTASRRLAAQVRQPPARAAGTATQAGSCIPQPFAREAEPTARPSAQVQQSASGEEGADPEPDGDLRAHDAGTAGQRPQPVPAAITACRKIRGPRSRRPIGDCAACLPRRAIKC